MKRALLIASLCMVSCSPSRVLVQSRQTDSVRIDEKIRIRTQIKYVPVIVHIPDQQTSVIAEPSDTSHLETKYAASDAFIRPDGKLYHDLRNKPQEKSEIVPVEITDTTATSTIVRQEQERIEVPVPMAAVLEHVGKNRMGTAGRSDYRNHRATKIIVMESCRAHTIIAGTSFALLITALRDDVELPEELPETIPSAWLDNLDRYRIVLLLSTSKHGPKAIAGTAAEYELKIERRDSARYFVNIPASATEEMEEGEIVLTVELHDTQTDTVMKAERRTVPLVKARL